MPSITVNDVDLYYELTGPQGMPVVAFSNSIGTALEMWDAQAEALSSLLFWRPLRVCASWAWVPPFGAWSSAVSLIWCSIKRSIVIHNTLTLADTSSSMSWRTPDLFFRITSEKGTSTCA